MFLAEQFVCGRPAATVATMNKIDRGQSRSGKNTLVFGHQRAAWSTLNGRSVIFRCDRIGNHRIAEILTTLNNPVTFEAVVKAVLMNHQLVGQSAGPIRISPHYGELQVKLSCNTLDDDTPAAIVRINADAAPTAFADAIALVCHRARVHMLAGANPANPTKLASAKSAEAKLEWASISK